MIINFSFASFLKLGCSGFCCCSRCYNERQKLSPKSKDYVFLTAFLQQLFQLLYEAGNRKRKMNLGMVQYRKWSISTYKTKECIPCAIILFSICILGNKVWKNISNYSFVHHFLALYKLHPHFGAWKKLTKMFSSRHFPVDLLLGNLYESWPAVKKIYE